MALVAEIFGRGNGIGPATGSPEATSGSAKVRLRTVLGGPGKGTDAQTEDVAVMGEAGAGQAGAALVVATPVVSVGAAAEVAGAALGGGAWGAITTAGSAKVIIGGMTYERKNQAPAPTRATAGTMSATTQTKRLARGRSVPDIPSMITLRSVPSGWARLARYDTRRHALIIDAVSEP